MTTLSYSTPRPSSTLSNHTLRDDIREYWSERAEGFDRDPGHKISEGREQQAWAALFARHLGAADGRRLLDLASGTGEIALLCHRLGFEVTGLDWAEPMLDRARAKAVQQGAAIGFLQADAERTMLPDASMDVIVTRHLVWTLVDPGAAFAEWRRVLRPGGQILIIDGDFVTRSWIGRGLARLLPKAIGQKTAGPMALRHRQILSQVFFSQGARADQVAALLREAGFKDIRIDQKFRAIHNAQARNLGLFKSLLRRSEHRYAITARA